jgi:PAS domain S-box-containing protein
VQKPWVSDRVRIEPAPHSARDELQMILDSVPAFIWYKDRDNRIVRANRLAAESVGMSIADLEGRSTYDLYPDEAAKYHQDDLEVIRSGHPKLGIIEPLLTVYGEKRWIRTDKIPHRDASGEIVGVVVFAVDVTERIQSEQALQAARDRLEECVEVRTCQLGTVVENLRKEIVERQHNEERVRQQQSLLAHLLRLRTVEGMAAQLAHEINQPLAAIANFAGGMTRRLQSGAVDLDEAQQVMAHISRQVQRAGEVVRRLRDFVRREGPRRARCDLAEVVREAADLIEAEAQRRSVTLRLVFDRQVPPVDIDRVQIEQVVVNLLTNSLDAMEDASPWTQEIVVETLFGGDSYAEVRVRDTGKGLPAGDPEMLFAPFFTSRADGLGMGLWISQSIIVAHGGEVRAQPNPGRGATVAFTLPVAR